MPENFSGYLFSVCDSSVRNVMDAEQVLGTFSNLLKGNLVNAKKLGSSDPAETPSEV